MANSHPGSYCGQDAYSDMLVTEKQDGMVHRKRTSPSVISERESRCAELYGRSAEIINRGGVELLEENNVRTVVRRLTPIECERLQSLPDNWTDLGDWVDSKGKNHKAADSPRYKAIGNGLALPFWEWLARRIAAQYEGKVTMGSLFDGISGFPLAFARAGVKPLWTSEIEEFPKAVCRKHFGDEDTGEEGDFYKYLI